MQGKARTPLPLELCLARIPHACKTEANLVLLAPLQIAWLLCAHKICGPNAYERINRLQAQYTDQDKREGSTMPIFNELQDVKLVYSETLEPLAVETRDPKAHV
jgi:hypothetical protein